MADLEMELDQLQQKIESYKVPSTPNPRKDVKKEAKRVEKNTEDELVLEAELDVITDNLMAKKGIKTNKNQKED